MNQYTVLYITQYSTNILEYIMACLPTIKCTGPWCLFTLYINDKHLRNKKMYKNEFLQKNWEEFLTL